MKGIRSVAASISMISRRVKAVGDQGRQAPRVVSGAKVFVFLATNPIEFFTLLLS